MRETEEETGLRVRLDALLGVYTKGGHRCPDGDAVQPITVFFRCSVAGGQPGGRDAETLQLRQDAETLQLRYFPPAQRPLLTDRQHQEAWSDLRDGRTGVVRAAPVRAPVSDADARTPMPGYRCPDARDRTAASGSPCPEGRGWMAESGSRRRDGRVSGRRIAPAPSPRGPGGRGGGAPRRPVVRCGGR